MVAVNNKYDRECNKPLPFRNMITGSVAQLPIISEYGKDKTLYVIKSIADNKIYDVVFDVPVEKFVKCYARWVHGELIQKAFPMLSRDMCEFVKTGITPEQWDKLFPPEDEE